MDTATVSQMLRNILNTIRVIERIESLPPSSRRTRVENSLTQVIVSLLRQILTIMGQENLMLVGPAQPALHLNGD